MGLSRLVSAATWFKNQLVTDVAIDAQITTPVNAAIDLLNGFQCAKELINIAAGQNTRADDVTFPTPYPTGVTPEIFTQVTVGSGNAVGVTITSRSNTGFTYTVFTTNGANVTSTIAADFFWLAVPL